MTTKVDNPLNLSLSQEPIFRRTGDDFEVAIYGRIYNAETLNGFDFFGCDRVTLIDLMNNLAGYFLIVFTDHKSGVTYLGNDIFGNFRLYFRRTGDCFVFSDDWQRLVEDIRSEQGGFQISEHEKYFFERHLHTTGGRTLIDGVEKMPPASLFTIAGDEVKQELYFRTGIRREVNDDYYYQRNLEFITENISNGLRPNLKNILLFSGGVDSTLLALIMREADIPFTAVLMRYIPASGNNLVDQHKSRGVAEQLGLDYEVIGESITDTLHVLNRAVRRHPFDRAFSVPAYRTTELLKEKYGPCNLINGQSSDSIYCSGPSGKTIGCLIQRFILSRFYARGSAAINRPTAWLTAMLYRYRWRMKFGFKIPTAFPEYARGLLDPEGYLPIMHTDEEHRKYQGYLSDISEDITRKLRFDTDSILMYMKMMYLQGHTNQFPIESAKEYGHNLVMPYLDSRIVYLKMQRQNELKNLFRPRYVLEDVMRRRFSFDIGIIDRNRNPKIDLSETNGWSEVEREVRARWDRISEEFL